MLHGHGGNINAVARQFGWAPDQLLDMSSNINPLGPPDGLMQYLSEHLMSVTELPEVDSQQAVYDYAEFTNIHPDRIVAANGTTHFIYMLPAVLASRRALILGPTYSDYADACVLNRIEYAFHIAEQAAGFRPHMDRIKDDLHGIDTVFICNPNNPTGSLIPFEELHHLCMTHPKINFIIDESYLPFVMDAEKESMVNARLENAIVLASLSKIYRIPGLRIGFVIASPRMARKIKKCLLPWSVNGLAQAAVHYLMKQKARMAAFVHDSRIFIDNQRHGFYQHLKPIHGLTPYPSLAPYVLIRLPAGVGSKEVWQQFAKEKILIRNCANFLGLSDEFIRISLKTPEANQMVSEKLNAFISNANSRIDNMKKEQVA